MSLFCYNFRMKKRIYPELPGYLGPIISIFPQEVKTMKRFSSGIINESYLITFTDKSQKVLRIYALGRKLAEAVREIKIMEKLRKKGIPIPEIYTIKSKKYLFFTDKNSKKRIALVMEFVPGSELKSSDHILIASCARTQAKMHTLLLKKRPSLKEGIQSTTKIKRWMDKEITAALSNTNLEKGIRKEISERYQNIRREWNKNQDVFLKIPFGVVHFDYDSSNILIKDNTIRGIIDFDDITEAPLAVDLGFSLWWWIFFNLKKNSSEIAKSYIKSYSYTRRLTQQEIDLLPLIIRVRNMILLCLLFINNSPKKIQRNKINQALRLDELLINKPAYLK